MTPSAYAPYEIERSLLAETTHPTAKGRPINAGCIQKQWMQMPD
jgi:hypothetical protein